MKKILILPGDGIGKEVTDAAVSVIDAVTKDLEISYGVIGAEAYRKTGYYLPPETMVSASKCDAIIATPVVGPEEKGYRDPLMVLRKQLDMSTVVKRFQSLTEKSGTQGLDCMLMTWNPFTFGTISEMETVDGVSSETYLDVAGCRRVFRMIEKIASEKQRRKILCVKDSELNPAMDSMFVDLFYEEFAASEFVIDDMEVCEAASRIVLDPAFADVLVTPAPYGNTLSGMLSGMCGGSYLSCAGYVRDGTGMFGPVHGPMEELAGKDSANPTGCILAAAMALDGVGMYLEGDKVRNALRSAYRKGLRTKDTGGDLTASEFTYRVAQLCEKSR
ncbi:MAG: isocitrate/isopropylmalate family dehydrogenase [Candidatus Methanomethylophilaceae archaeon]|jgi:isocitrate/isopropylmalate dehydrogenase